MHQLHVVTVLTITHGVRHVQLNAMTTVQLIGPVLVACALQHMQLHMGVSCAASLGWTLCN